MHCRWLTSRSLSQRKGSPRGGGGREGGKRSQPSLVNVAFNYVLNRRQSLYDAFIRCHDEREFAIRHRAAPRAICNNNATPPRRPTQKSCVSEQRQAAGHWTRWVNRRCATRKWPLSLSFSLVFPFPRSICNVPLSKRMSNLTWTTSFLSVVWGIRKSMKIYFRCWNLQSK